MENLPGTYVDDIGGRTGSWSMEDFFSAVAHGSECGGVEDWTCDSPTTQEAERVAPKESSLAEQADEDTVVEALADEQARLQRKVEVLQGRLLQQLANPSKGDDAPEDAVHSMELELLVLRQLADGELQRLQGRAASAAADTVARGELEAALLIEGAHIQAATTERTLREVLELVQCKLSDLEQEADVETELADQRRSCEQLAERIKAQQHCANQMCMRTENVGLRNVSLSRQLGAARKERAEQAARVRRCLLEDEAEEERCLQQCVVEERSVACRMVQSELWEEVQTWRSAVQKKRASIESRVSLIRQERVRLRELMASQRKPDTTGISNLEARLRSQFQEWQEESDEQMELAQEEVNLLEKMRSKLATRLQVQRCRVEEMDEAHTGAGEQDAHFLSTADLKQQEQQLQETAEAHVKEIVRLREVHATNEQRKSKLEQVCKELHGKVVASLMNQLADDDDHDTAATPYPPVPGPAAPSIDMQHEEVIEMRQLLALEMEVAEQGEVRRTSCERRLARSNDEIKAWREEVANQRVECEREDLAREEEIAVLRARLNSINEESTAVKKSLFADEAEMERLRASRRELGAELQARNVLQRRLAVRNSEAQATSVEAFHVFSEAVSKLEQGAAECSFLREENQHLTETIQARERKERFSTKELTSAKRELLQLHNALSSESACVATLQEEVSTITVSASQLQRAQAEGAELRVHIASLRRAAEWPSASSGVRNGLGQELVIQP